MFEIDHVSIDNGEDEAYSVLNDIRVISQNKDKNNILSSFFSLAKVHNPYSPPTEGLEQRPCYEHAKWFLDSRCVRGETKIYHVSMNTILYF
jgi:hypothetical protein